LLYFTLSQPTRGARIELRYGDCGISTVNVLDFIASARRTSITKAPDALPEPSVVVEFGGWAMPQSGVAFGGKD
jgi:hypothetical protein